IVIASARRSVGVGRVFYGDVQGFAEARYPHLAAEVFIENDNHPALIFHGSFGFREVGQHVMAPGNIRACMLLKDLCSYAYVQTTYGNALPNVSWLAARALPGRTNTLATGT
ncbi:MAG: hypothetical protein ACRERV_17695, partial [Methylococcales bacterium]